MGFRIPLRFPLSSVLHLSILFCSAAAHAQPDPAPANEEIVVNKINRILPLEVMVNGAKTGTWLLLERDGQMYAPADAFVEWRVQLPPDTKPIDFKLQDQAYYPLSAIPGYKFKLDVANQAAQLLFSPAAFAATRMTQEKSKRPVVSPVLPSLFVNYDTNYQTATMNTPGFQKNLGMLTEIGASNSWGVLTSSQVGQNLTNDPNYGASRGWIRLETTFTKDYPDNNKTLRLGDTSTTAGMWGRSVYFGGIQFGSNFSLTPGFVTNPIPVLSGIATAPSTVEMYVNNVLRQTSNVPTGPFAINDAPMLTGSGDVSIVTQDLLGRQTVVSQSFFVSTLLLAKGLDDWNINAGKLRNNLGIDSANYGANFVSGSWHHGYSNELTLESRVEASSQARTLGIGMVTSMPLQMIGQASLAASNSQSKNGGLWLLGLQQQTLHNAIQLQIQGASPNFQQLGQDYTTAPIKQQIAGNWTYTTTGKYSYGLGLASISTYNNTRISTVTGNYSMPIGDNSNLTITASRAMYVNTGTSLMAFLVIPLDNNRVVSAQAYNQNSFVSVTQNPDQQHNLGWRVLAGTMQGQADDEGGLNYMGRYGQVTADVSNALGTQSLRLDARGGLVLADKTLFASQYLDQSFAVAEVPGYDHIGVGLGNNVLTRTDGNGVALIPQLMPYQYNPVRLNPDDLPMSAEIDNIEQYVVPAWRSGVKVTFPVRGGVGALLKIVFDDGQPAPAGAVVQIEGDKEEFYVARRGETFVTGLLPSNHLVLNWNGQQCKLEVAVPPAKPDDIPRLGPLPCKGVAR
jgi:outer membrane usher protein